ncbi:MAG: cell wall-active antibiotics response protein [Chloroflexi bacterium]|nr:cell wall-active antibiotics response protein [Chloroflexota bacterium]
MERRSTFWGLVLVALGVLFLLQSLGIIAVNLWSLVWPVLLIVLGAWILLGAVYRPHSRAEQVSIPLEGAARSHIRVRHGAGRLTVDSNAPADKLVEGSFGGGLDYRARHEGDALMLDLRIPHDAFPGIWGPWSWNAGSLDWSFAVNGAIPLELEFEIGANETRLDLGRARVTDLRIKTGANSTDVRLPTDAGSTRVRIEGGAASVTLRVPEGVAARIRAGGGLLGIDVDTRRFPKSGDTFASPDYDTAKNKVDVETEMGAGSISVR